MGDNRVHYFTNETSAGIGLTACSLTEWSKDTDKVSNVTCVKCLQKIVIRQGSFGSRDVLRFQRNRAEKKAAASNRENEALKRKNHDQKVRLAILEGFLEHTDAQVGYKVRYEKLVANLQLIRELANPDVNGIPYDEPKV